MKHKKIFILVIICSLGLLLSRCINTGEGSDDPRGIVYAGSESCRKCHRSVYDAYMTTAHYQTTRPVSEKNVLGSFHPDSNVYAYDSSTRVVMEKRDSGFYQVLYVHGRQQEAHRMDLVFGRKHAQTFLYWQGNKSFELPVSYYSAVHGWATSPGYLNSAVNFTRFIGKNCYECHSSYIYSQLNATPNGIEETVDRNTLLYGIDCERCHGPALNHVNYHEAYPDEKEAKYIVRAASLTRQQKLDACAVCHSGNDREKEISTFGFKMGDTLANFFLPWSDHHRNDSNIDVHGKQYQALVASKCFLVSKAMDCATCHNPHNDASKDLAAYSIKCESCHQHTDHPSVKLDEAALKNNCIDCHMPLQPSRAIGFMLSGSQVKSAYMLRTHRIAVYGKL